MSLLQCIRRLIRSNNYNVSTIDYQVEEEDLDEPPEYEYESPPDYDDTDDNEKSKLENDLIESKKKCKSKNTIKIQEIINNIRNDKYNLGCVILDKKMPSPSKIIKYLVKNYSKSNDIMLYMIKNYKHNHIVRVGKHNEILNTTQNIIFFIGPINLNIQINNNVFNFSKYKCGIFSNIFINEKGWQGNAIHNITSFDGTASASNTIVNIDNFINYFIIQSN
jgi:hypothetical protein